MFTEALKKGVSAHDICFGELERVTERLIYVSFSSEMNDDTRLIFIDGSLDKIDVTDIAVGQNIIIVRRRFNIIFIRRISESIQINEESIRVGMSEIINDTTADCPAPSSH